MLTIPLTATPSQTLSVTLTGQFCKMQIVQKSTGVFLSLTVGAVDVCNSSICLDRVSIVRLPGLIGTLRFVDTQGVNDPEYTGFNTRYKLVYQP